MRFIFSCRKASIFFVSAGDGLASFCSWSFLASLSLSSFSLRSFSLFSFSFNSFSFRALSLSSFSLSSFSLSLAFFSSSFCRSSFFRRSASSVSCFFLSSSSCFLRFANAISASTLDVGAGGGFTISLGAGGGGGGGGGGSTSTGLGAAAMGMAAHNSASTDKLLSCFHWIPAVKATIRRKWTSKARPSERPVPGGGGGANSRYAGVAVISL